MISLTKITYSNKQKKLISNLDINIDKGEYVYITGPSGCGKTTLLNIIGGLVIADSGDLTVGQYTSKDSNYDHVRSELISYILQDYGLLKDITVKRNIDIATSLSNAQPITDWESSYILDELELTPLLKQQVKNLSGGEIQRVKIAQALIRNTPIILCDEPTSNLDNRLKNTALNLLEKQNRDKDKTIVHVTHDLSIINDSRRIITL